MGGLVSYNYGLMASVSSEIHQCGAVAQALLEGSNAEHQMLLAGFQGDPSTAFVTSFQQYQKAQTDTIAVTTKGATAYAHGASSMQSNATQWANSFTV
ncbi:MAG: hypothetical protein WAV90_25645 [Gordonia amarae]